MSQAFLISAVILEVFQEKLAEGNKPKVLILSGGPQSIFEDDNDKKRATAMGIQDHDKKYSLNEIVLGDSIFCATGITSGDLVNGISIKNKKFESQSLVTHKNSNTKKIISKVFDIE